MAPKVNCNAQKLANIHTWIQKSRAVWNIKDLEKHISSVASINSMQVKDYIQSLQDDNKICCEKIGAGNWYWSFPSQQKNLATSCFEQAKSEHEKLFSTVQDLRSKLQSLAAVEQDAEDSTESRDTLISRKTILEADVKELQGEVKGYSEDDPVEWERKKVDGREAFEEVERVTDDIEVLEGVLKGQGVSEEDLAGFRRGTYGDEVDEEGVLGEVVWEE